MEYYSAAKEQHLAIWAPWTDREGHVLSELSQGKGQRTCVICQHGEPGQRLVTVAEKEAVSRIQRTDWWLPARRRGQSQAGIQEVQAIGHEMGSRMRCTTGVYSQYFVITVSGKQHLRTVLKLKRTNRQIFFSFSSLQPTGRRVYPVSPAVKAANTATQEGRGGPVGLCLRPWGTGVDPIRPVRIHML